MLSSPDADLARRDSHLPGLPILLDPDSFAELLRAKTGSTEPDSIRVHYLRYKPDTSCLVAYQAQSTGQSVELFARAFRHDSLNKYKKMQGRLGSAGLSDRTDLWPDEQVAVYRFPADDALPSLAILAEDRTRTQLLSSVLPEPQSLRRPSLETLHYKPERRYVAKLISRTREPAVLKAYADQNFSNASAVVKYVHSRGPLRVPRRLGRSRRNRLLVLEWLPGETLDELIVKPGYDPAFTRLAGAALAELHVQRIKHVRSVDSKILAQALESNAKMVAHLCPHLAGRAHRIAGHLTRTVKEQPGGRCAIHGDFSADQVLLDTDVAAIVDLDSAGRGDPLIDLGSFAARLLYETVAGRLSTTVAETAIEDLIEGYGLSRAIRRPDMLWLYAAIGLLRLAAEPFRYRVSNWPDVIEAIVEQVEALAKNRGI